MDNYTTIPLKVCTKCERLLPATTFFFYKSRGGLRADCKKCQAIPHPPKPQARDGYKFCSTCNLEKPATEEFFPLDKKNKDGFSGCCKECRKIYLTQYYLDNKEKINESSRQDYWENRERYIELGRQWREDNPEYIKEYNHQRYLEKREAIKKRTSEYYYSNHDKMKDAQREYYRNNREHHFEQSRKWVKANPEKRKEINRRYSKKHPIKGVIKSARRRARKRQLPDTFTVEQWIVCLEYFNYCCAVCGNQLRDLFGDVEPHADHWIPLVSPHCLGTVSKNMVCLCNSCNLSKGATLPYEWLTEKFGTRKANEILARIQAYFDSLAT